MKNEFKKLKAFKTEFKPNWPSEAWYGRDGYERGDEKCSFFSETYLYNLIGKEDARSLLGLMQRLEDSFKRQKTGLK